MAVQQSNLASASKQDGPKLANSGAVRKHRERRVYEHEMTDAERFALQIVLKGKAACAQLAISVQEGKKINPEVVKLCSRLVEASADMLFA